MKRFIRKVNSLIRKAAYDRCRLKLYAAAMMMVVVIIMAAVSAVGFWGHTGSAGSADDYQSVETAVTGNSSDTSVTSDASGTTDVTDDTTGSADNGQTAQGTMAEETSGTTMNGTDTGTGGTEQDTAYPDYDQAIANLTAKQLENVTVALDPGHGGIDGGTYHRDTLEKNLNLAVALELGGMLEDMGVNVVYTRKTDVLIPLEKIARIVEDSGADLFLCIHHNATDDGPVWAGTETHYGTRGATDGAMDDRKFGCYIQEEVVDALGLADIGLIRSPDMVVLRLTSMPAVIVEMGYISNDGDRAVLTAPGYTEKAAMALKKGMIRAIAALLIHS